jgi:phosphoenolpyruvate carboxykinase (ATP)
LKSATTQPDPIFGFDTITECPNVPSEILIPAKTWDDNAAFQATAKKLAALFVKNFATFESGASEGVRAAAPRV